MTDEAVVRQKKFAFMNKIKEIRAQKEREMQLDAFNYLHKTNISDDNTA